MTALNHLSPVRPRRGLYFALTGSTSYLTFR